MRNSRGVLLAILALLGGVLLWIQLRPDEKGDAAAPPSSIDTPLPSMETGEAGEAGEDPATLPSPPPSPTSVPTDTGVPVTIAGSLEPSGWSLSIVIADPRVPQIKEIFYKINDDSEWTSTGFFDERSASGLPVPKPVIDGLELPPGIVMIWINYHDAQGKEYGPYVLPFDSAKQAQESREHIEEFYRDEPKEE